MCKICEHNYENNRSCEHNLGIMVKKKEENRKILEHNRFKPICAQINQPYFYVFKKSKQTSIRKNL